MDFTAILQSLWQNLWFLVPLFVLVAILKSAQFKVWVGEAIVNLSALICLNREIYHLIRNVTLPTEDVIIQIDHIIVSPSGAFVGETKNIKRWIFGGANQCCWTPRICRDSQEFKNPLHQDYKHVKTGQSRLWLSGDQVCSLVFFIGIGTFKTPMQDNVTQGFEFLRFILAHSSGPYEVCAGNYRSK